MKTSLIRTLLTLAATTFLLSASAFAAEEESTLARGGMLYDKWYKVTGAEEPTMSHALYPSTGKYTKAKDNWRCKECHGWDTLGKDGAYASGNHASGIIGINGYAGKSVAATVALLKDPMHGYGDKLSADDLNAVAMFVTKGTIDMDKYIDRASKKPLGDAAKGEAYYNTVCANCHGMDGLEPDDMKPFGAQMGNPWEVMHKILNGQPDEAMPALRAFDHQIAADIMSYMTTLPSKR